MKQIMRLITIFFLSVMLLSCSKSPSDRLDETLDDLLSSTRYEVATIFLTDHFDEGGSWQRTVTLTRDNESYKISNRNLSYHFTTYLLNEDEQYNAYIKISNQGLYEYVKYKEEPDRFLNTIDFDVDALSSSMFDYKNDMFF